jgi:hypothetical protein
VPHLVHQHRLPGGVREGRDARRHDDGVDPVNGSQREPAAGGEQLLLAEAATGRVDCDLAGGWLQVVRLVNRASRPADGGVPFAYHGGDQCEALWSIPMRRQFPDALTF